MDALSLLKADHTLVKGLLAELSSTTERGVKTRQELYEEAKRKNLPGRSKMGRAELARALGHK